MILLLTAGDAVGQPRLLLGIKQTGTEQGPGQEVLLGELLNLGGVLIGGKLVVTRRVCKINISFSPDLSPPPSPVVLS